MSPAVLLEGVTKRYRTGGGVTDVSLQVEPGEVFGFLGPNGAGKSTTIRLLLDLIRPDSGRITILGLDARRDSVAVRRRVGYLPGELVLYDRLTARELLGHFASLRGGLAAGGIEALADRLDLGLDRQIRELSKGNKQKVGLVQALMGRPDLLILDEPTSGLDPLVQREVHALLEEQRARGCAVFLSTHVLGEAERVADRVGVLRDGRLVAVESVADLHRRALHRIEVRTAAPLPSDAFAALRGVRVTEHDGTTCRLDVTGPIDPVVKVLARYEVVDLTVGDPDLEDVFLAFYEPAGSGAPASSQEADDGPA